MPQYENIYETVNNDPSVASNRLPNQNEYQPGHPNIYPDNEQLQQGQAIQRPEENIYESIEDLRRRSIIHDVPEPSSSYSAGGYVGAGPAPGPIPGPSSSSSNASSSSVTYGRLGNSYGRIDVIGHGIGRIERHLSSSCGSGIDSHYSNMEAFDPSGRISKVSVQWLLVNKWLPLWIANTDNGGRDYRIIDFLLGQRGDYESMPPQGVQQRECNGIYHHQFQQQFEHPQQQLQNIPPNGPSIPEIDNQPIYQPVFGQNFPLNLQQMYQVPPHNQRPQPPPPNISNDEDDVQEDNNNHNSST